MNKIDDYHRYVGLDKECFNQLVSDFTPHYSNLNWQGMQRKYKSHKSAEELLWKCVYAPQAFEDYSFCRHFHPNMNKNKKHNNLFDFDMLMDVLCCIHNRDLISHPLRVKYSQT
jgi:hypothetical protein